MRIVLEMYWFYNGLLTLITDTHESVYDSLLLGGVQSLERGD